MTINACAALLALPFVVAGAMALAQDVATPVPDYEQWPLLKSEFPSTGGGGIIIGGYNPVVNGTTCATTFTATTPDGTIYRNVVEFDAVPVQGGTLCTNGRWRAQDGSASGTTPFQVFFKDGVARASP